MKPNQMAMDLAALWREKIAYEDAILRSAVRRQEVDEAMALFNEIPTRVTPADLAYVRESIMSTYKTQESDT